jgi:hypothetical protein
MIALLSGAAYAQQQAPMPQAGEEDKEKTQQQKAADKAAQEAYKKSLGNIPDQGPTDPWGNVRSDGTPKPVAKAAPAKRTKTGSTAN